MFIVLLFAAQLGALFGEGDIVFDPTNYANAVLIYLQTLATVEQLRLEYEHLIRMAQTIPVNMGIRYRAVLTPWTTSSPPTDRYGVLSGWSNAVNTGGSVLEAYNRATEALREYGEPFGLLSGEQQQHLSTGFGSVELADGANLHSIQTIGTLRKNSAAVERTIQALENDSLSLDPSMNTEIGVLNKINAASIVGLRNTQDTNKLLTAVLEQQVTEQKAKRDGAAREINAYGVQLREAGHVWQRYSETMADSMRAFRLP